MINTKHEFHEFSNYEYYSYAGAQNLPNGKKPMVYHIHADDHELDIILAGDEDGNTLVSMISDSSEYTISLTGFNKCHEVIANSLVDRLLYDMDLLIMNFYPAVDRIAEDYGMIRIQ